MPKILTLCIVHEPGRILLGMKKRGFGAGKWNGFGGKVGADKTIEDAAKREVIEECGLVVEEMRSVGKLNFTFEGGTDVLEVNIFDVTKFSGEPTESDEMKPQWFALDAIPYSTMWPADKFWIPAMLEGKTISGAIDLAADGSVGRNEIVTT